MHVQQWSTINSYPYNGLPFYWHVVVWALQRLRHVVVWALQRLRSWAWGLSSASMVLRQAAFFLQVEMLDDCLHPLLESTAAD